MLCPSTAHPAISPVIAAAQGYGGTLCATCASYDGVNYALDADFNCNQCYSKWATVLIAVAMFIANTLWLGRCGLGTTRGATRHTRRCSSQTRCGWVGAGWVRLATPTRCHPGLPPNPIPD